MMPSLLKYFVITGGALLALLFVANAVFEPGGPGPRLVRTDASKPTVKLDPQASKVERLRAEEAAEKAAKAAAAAEAEAQLVVTEPPMPARQAAAPAPAQVSAPVALATEPEGEAARAKRAAQERIRAEKAKAKKVRVARERARQRALEEASAQQAAPAYGFAPRPAYGPFGQGGGWQGQRW